MAETNSSSIDFPSQTRTTNASGKSAEDGRITSEYIERERRWANEAGKVEQRERIAEFFLKWHKPNEPLSLLSLPGMHWQFENLLLSRRNKCRFTGIERTWGVIELGRPYMPGVDKRFKDWTVSRGKSVRGFRSNIARWLWCTAAELLQTFDSNRLNKGHSREFSKKFKANSCIWLDFTAQLCTETRYAIEGIQTYSALASEIVPVCVTVMAARDDHHCDEDRADEIWGLLGRRQWRNFALLDSWTYTHHGVPMLNVMGLLTRKGRPCVPQSTA